MFEDSLKKERSANENKNIKNPEEYIQKAIILPLMIVFLQLSSTILKYLFIFKS